MGTKKFYLNHELLKEVLEKNQIENSNEIIKELEKEVESLVKKRLKNLVPFNSEVYNNAESFLNAYPTYDLNSLPSWVKSDISNAKIIGNSKQTIIMPDGKKYQLNNTLNHLSGSEWNYFTNSVINTNYKTSGLDSYAHKIRKIHPTPKPPQLMRDIINFFTKENEIVFDYFMGVGGSLIGAGLSQRRAVGVDLNIEYIKAYEYAAKEINLPIFKTINDDCMNVLSNVSLMEELFGKEKISLVLLDPPYGNMMSRKKTGSDIKVYGKIATPFTNSDKDFGNLESEDFYIRLKKSLQMVMKYLKTKGHIVVFIKDIQPEGKRTNLFHSRIIDSLNEIENLHYKGLKIWADQTVKLFPYGYPFSFVANQIHQYILIFRKEI